jgi:hypothetical protein
MRKRSRRRDAKSARAGLEELMDIEDLVRPQVLHLDLSEDYRLMAADETREADAHEWAEGTCRDVADETR